jgi:hypothetical protein
MSSIRVALWKQRCGYVLLWPSSMSAAVDVVAVVRTVCKAAGC